MKEFWKALLYTVLIQILIWGIYIYFNELTRYSSDTNEGSFIAILLLLIPLFIYFIFNKKVIEKYNLDGKKFNIYLSTIWILFSLLMIVLSAKFIPMLENLGIFNKCHFLCILDGFEYTVFGIGMILQVVLLSVYKLCCYLYNKLKNNKK